MKHLGSKSDSYEGFEHMRLSIWPWATALAILSPSFGAAAYGDSIPAKTSTTSALDAAYVAALTMRKTRWSAEQVVKWCNEQRDSAYLASGARFEEKLTRDQATDPIAKRFPTYVRKGEPTELLAVMVFMIDVMYDEPAATFDRTRLTASVHDSCIRAAIATKRLSGQRN